MAYFPNSISFTDNESIDANARLRTSNPSTIFASSFIYNTSSLDWSLSASTNASLTHLSNESACLMTIGTSSGDVCIYQTKMYMKPLSGKSFNFMQSFLFGSPVTNVSRSVGFGDNNNGFFLTQGGNGDINFVHRLKTSGVVVDNVISQSSWNVDKMDGSGISGCTLDLTKIQSVSIDSYWPSGDVRIGFRFDGLRYVAHKIETANTFAGPSISSFNLPMRFHMKNYAASAGATMKAYHASARSEGEDQNVAKFMSTGSINQITVTNRRPLISIRPKQFYNGFVNRGSIEINGVDIYTTTNSCYWELVYGGTLTGASWSDVNTRYSMAEADISATAIAGGIVIQSGFNPASSAGASSFASVANPVVLSKYPICLNDISGSDNSGIIITLVCTSFTGNSINASTINWFEHI